MGIADTVLWNNTNRKGTTQNFTKMKDKHTLTHIDTPIHRHTLRKLYIHTHTLNNLLKLNLYKMLFGL